MTLEEFKINIQQLSPKSYGAIGISKTPNAKYFQLYHYITENTKFLPVDTPIKGRIFCIMNNIAEVPKCHCGCGAVLINFKRKYIQGHSNSDDSVKLKKEQAFKAHIKSTIPPKIKPKITLPPPIPLNPSDTPIKFDILNIVKKYTPNIDQKELDIYIPEKHIAFEIDGLYWHSELNGKDKWYHLKKTQECESKNIRLIHIFDDEWNNHRKIVVNRIRHILGCDKYRIGARKCKIEVIDAELKNKFLDKYHIQGSDRCQIKLGAFYKKRLVSVMTFSKLRTALGQAHQADEYELSRFCTMGNFSIMGIANKFMSYFEANYHPKKIISYADRRWSCGDLYKQLGFTMKHFSKPNYWYTKDYNSRLHRFNFRKDVLNVKLEKFDPMISEWQNMINNKWDRIWDCGNYVFEKTY